MRKSVIVKALRNIVKNSLMSFASIVSVAFTLIMLGIVMLSLVNLNFATQKVAERFDTIKFAVDKSYDEAKIKELQQQFEQIPNVKKVVHITKEEAFETFRASLGKDARVLDGMKENPLPDTFEIIIEDIAKAENTIAAIDKIDSGDNIYYDRDVAQIITNIIRIIRTVGTVLILALLFVTILSIVNTIRVGISSHREEITIMRYVGATRGYIRGPYLVEGILLGLVGASISAVAVYYSYNKIVYLIKSYLAQMTNQIILDDPTLLPQVIIVNLIIGMSVGLLGSLYSMRKYIKV